MPIDIGSYIFAILFGGLLIVAVLVAMVGIAFAIITGILWAWPGLTPLFLRAIKQQPVRQHQPIRRSAPRHVHTPTPQPIGFQAALPESVSEASVPASRMQDNKHVAADLRRRLEQRHALGSHTRSVVDNLSDDDLLRSFLQHEQRQKSFAAPVAQANKPDIASLKQR